MYYTGQDIPQDYAQAVQWYRKAAEQGLAQAQYNLGFMYDKGRGVRQDDAQAVAWYRKAAEQGYANVS
jgi:TPR repeat protein